MGQSIERHKKFFSFLDGLIMVEVWNSSLFPSEAKHWFLYHIIFAFDKGLHDIFLGFNVKRCSFAK